MMDFQLLDDDDVDDEQQLAQAKPKAVDARRRLEQRLEEVQLKRDLLEFDLYGV